MKPQMVLLSLGELEHKVLEGPKAKKVLERVLSSSVKRAVTVSSVIPANAGIKQPILIKVSKTDDQ